MVQQISDSEGLDKILTDAGSKLVVIDFYATWCGPCKVTFKFANKKKNLVYPGLYMIGYGTGKIILKLPPF